MHLRYNADRASPSPVLQTSWSTLDGDAQIWGALDQMPFSAGQGGSYHNWDFPWDQQVLLIPDADQGVQVVINR